MNLPRTVRVAGRSVRVVARDYPGKELFGEFDGDNSKGPTIFIRRGLDSEAAYSTLYHEMWHACSHLTGISYLETHEFPDEAIARVIDSIYLPAVFAVRDKFTP